LGFQTFKEMRFVTILLALLCSVHFSCQKELSVEISDSNSTTNPAIPPSGGGKLVRIQQGIDPDITMDTVLLISYDGSQRITQIVDSLYTDTIKVTYDASTGRLAQARGRYSNVQYLFNSGGQLIEINYANFGHTGKYTFEYTNGVLTKKNEYSDIGPGGSLQLWSYSMYTFNGENISRVITYHNNGSLFYQTDYTFGNHANSFKDLGLLNVSNTLGLDKLTDLDIYFCKNDFTKAVTDGITNITLYTYNSQQQPVKATIEQSNPYPYLNTWMFQYK